MPTASDDSDDSADKLVEHALNLFVYAPLGLALEARDLLPKLADRGRGQVVMARLAGRYVAQQRQQKAAREPDNSEAAESPDPSNDELPANDELPIDDYDTLSANQIVPLLASLTKDELHAVWAFEQANRGRVTVTNRIDKLLR